MKKIDDKKKISSAWFKELRDKICQELEKFEISGKKFKKKKWNRDIKGSNNLRRKFIQFSCTPPCCGLAVF